MGGARNQSVLCYGVSAQHDVILTRAKETLWLAEMTRRWLMNIGQQARDR